MYREIRANYLPLKTRLNWIVKGRTGWILGRMACMGSDVVRLINPKFPVLNIQKGRIDYILDVNQEKSKRARTKRIAPFIQRTDIMGLIAQEECAGFLPSLPPQAILMDSYSELTDQRFVNIRRDWSFVSNYSDVSHGERFKEDFLCKGLLPEDQIEAYYRTFIEFVDRKYGKIPIIYMHFPKKLEAREVFRRRHDIIQASINEISRERSNFVSLAVPEELVDWPSVKVEDAKFPYHYNARTYEFLAKKIKEHQISKLFL